jgi:hypothetical protein
MKKNIKPLSIVITLLVTCFLFVVLFPIFKTQAQVALIDDVYLYLSRVQKGLSGITQLTGTVSVTNGSATVTGSGTSFQDELSVGDIIKINTSTHKVDAIASQTSLTLTSDYLGTTGSGLTAYTDQSLEMILVFKTTGNFITEGTIEIQFPPGDANADVGAWCRTEGALTVTGVTEAPPSTAAITAVTGETTLAATCDEGTGGAGDIITISDVAALSSANTYGVKLSSNTGKLGTSNSVGSKTVVVEIDDGVDKEVRAFGVYIISSDTVEVVAEVMETPTVECTLDTTKVSMPVLYPGAIISEETVSDQIETTSPSDTGYYWAAYGKGNGTDAAGLWNAAESSLIASGATTVDISAANSQGFGINIGTPSDGGTVTANFVHGTYGRYGGIVYGPAGAKLILYNTASVTAETADVIYGARASSTADTGTYREFITFVCGGYY